MAPMAPPPAPAPPPVDFSNMFSPAPLPGPSQGAPPPPNPFGPAPLPFGGYRQEGGPVQPGLAYIVGEAGPELIVPQQPGMVLPNQTLTGRASAQDGAVRSGPLSTRGATPVGSGRGMTPERRLEIAARRGDQRANLALFNADQFGRNQRGAARALPPPMPMPMSRTPLPPSAARPMPNFPPRSPAQQPPPEPMAAPQFDMANMLPPMAPAGAMAPLPPSTLMGGSGVPGPPAIDFRPLPGNPGYGVPVINGEVQRQFLPMPPNPGAQPPPLSAQEIGMARSQGFEPTQIDGRSFDAQGVPYLRPIPQPTERVTVDAEGKQTRTLTQPRGATPAPAPGPAGGAAPIERTTSSGVKVQVSMPDQAGRMTGQMPNEAYANPLTPEQSLAAARAEYLATGNDAALQKHFQQFPSQAVQLNRQEGQVWNQIGQNVGNYQQELIGVANALEDRNRFINANAMGALGAGAAAIDYGRMQPAMNRRAARDLPPLNPDLIARAGELNQQAQAASALSNPVLMAQAMPPATPRLNPTRRSF